LVTTRRIFGLSQHRSGSPRGADPNARIRFSDTPLFEQAAEITDIIPFNEFGDLDDLEFRENCAFDRESQVVHAPELDDLNDTDDLTPMRLAVPSEFRPDAREVRTRSSSRRARESTPTSATAWPRRTSSTSPAGADCTASPKQWAPPEAA
jgi:hypothetical protein